MKPYMNSYAAGVLLGLVLLAAFFTAGQGLGASGAFVRLTGWLSHLIAPKTIEANAYLGTYFRGPRHILNNWLFFLAIGVAIGGFISGRLAGRNNAGVTRGPRVSVQGRLILALVGGILTGVAARISLGCTSGQALSGGALLSVGAWFFMFSIFFGGYLFAWFVRKEWI